MDKKTLIEQLEIDEGFRSSVYQDSLGFWTIGIGRMVDARKRGGISKAEAFVLLSNDIDACAADLDTALPWWRNLSNARQNVLLNMCFNLGLSGLLGFKNTLAFIESGQYGRAADAMLQSKWAGQVGERAVRLAKVMRG